ncbi:MAG: LysE family transporter [Bryobacteraceae bacterium]
MLPYLLSGLSLGVASGLSPGPLLALLVSQTLRHGLRDGLRVAFAPILSDAPIVVLCLVVLSRVSGLGHALAWMSIVGGAFVGYLGYESLRACTVDFNGPQTAPRSFIKAVLINLLNPNVYLFWAMVGAPMLLKGWAKNSIAAFAFAGGFYACLVGSKILVAIAVSRSRSALTGRGYQIALRLLGALLLVVAAWMFAGGIAGLAAPGTGTRNR